MPGKGARRRNDVQRRKKVEVTSDDESLNDECSGTSGFSDNRSVLEDGNETNVYEEMMNDEDDSVDQLIEEIDGLTQKSSNGRILSYQTVERVFAINYLAEFAEDRKMTITETIEKSLKRGRGDEQASAARLSTLLCVQLGMYDSAETVCKYLKPTLTYLAKDDTVSINGRLECCWALSMNQFLSGDDVTDTVEITQLLSTIFSGSYLKGNGTQPTISVDTAALHAAAISSWTLLLTIMSPADVYNLLESSGSHNFMPSLERLSELLQSPHLEVRMSAGEALAVIFERGRDYSEDYEQDWVLDLVGVLRDLATDSNKYRAKKDRKQQRASFREILRYIEDDIIPESSVRFGKEEVLYLEGWCARIQYKACCRLLGPGINIHLAENQLLREIFDLGDPVIEPVSHKPSKKQRALMNAASSKVRTIQRNKLRDKRSPAFDM